MKSVKIPNGMIFKDLSFQTFLNVIDVSNIDRSICFNYCIKIHLGVNFFIYKKYYNYSIYRIINRLENFNKEFKENKNKILWFSYIRLQKIKKIK